MPSTGILQYFSHSSTLPNPRNSLTNLPSSAIVSANTEVMRMMSEMREMSKKRKAYHKYTPKDRAAIGKYTAENGAVWAKGYF